MNKFVLYVFAIVAVVLILATFITASTSRKKLKTYSECRGVITAFNTDLPGGILEDGNTTTISPVIKYQVNGNTYEFFGKYYSTSMKVGDEVTVLYDKNDCSNAVVKKGLYVAPIITGGLGCVFTVALVICLVLKSKGII